MQEKSKSDYNRKTHTCSLAFLRSCSYCFAFVLFLAKNIKIVPYDEKKHGGTSEIGGYIESDPRKFDYIFGAIRDH